MKVKYQQWTMNQNNLFNELNDLTPNSIIQVLGVEQLHFLYLTKHGNKEVLPSLETATTKEVAKVINSMFMKKWVRLAELYLNEFEVGFDSSSMNNAETTDSDNESVSTNSTSQVSAYNDDEMSDVEGEIDSVVKTGTKTHTNNSNVVNVNIKSIDIQRNLLENSNITNVICQDVSSFIALSIY